MEINSSLFFSLFCETLNVSQKREKKREQKIIAIYLKENKR